MEMAHTDVMIEIKLRTMDSGTHDLLISNQIRVRNLKVDITLLTGIPMEQQRLLYRGKVLRDDRVISSYNVQNDDALHLVRTVQGMSSNGSSSIRPVTYSSSNSVVSHSTDINGISPGIQREIPNATYTFLSRYLNRIRREHTFNRTNMIEILGSSPSQGILEVEQLARLLSFNRHVLINQTSQLFLDFERDLLQNLIVDDLRMRSKTMQTIQMMFEYVGRHFLELGRAMRQDPTRLSQYDLSLDGLLQRQVPTRLSEYDLYLDGLLQRQNSSRSLLQTGSFFSDEDVPEFVFPNMPSQHQHEQASVTIRQQNNTELTDMHGEENNINSLSPSREDFIPDGDIHVEETGTPGATTDNVTENMGTSVSSGPSTVENICAHELSIEPSDENNWDFTSTR